MKNGNGISKVSLLLLVLAGAAFALVAHAVEADSGPVALVQTALVSERSVAETLRAFGSVEPGPRQLRVIAAPRASIVALDVAAGMHVKRGAPLMTLAPTPEAAVLYAQAASQAGYARSALKRTQNLFQEKLATRDQLAAAQKALSDAEANLAAQQRMGGGGPTVIRAPADGVVSAVGVASGAHVAADTALLTYSEQGGNYARLGVTPTQAAQIHSGMPVNLSAVFDAQLTLATRISQVGGQVDPASGLVDVLAPLAGKAAARFLPGGNVTAKITLKQVRSLAVPRAAVLRDTQGAYVFIVKNDIAHRVNVKAGLDDGIWVAVSGDLRASERVVTLGNYELTDGMAVRETAR
ncbi:MAG: efflux RND transporter periplasmic adaptor subunit [Gammaproteobacteria bacterium]|nr:efflux RND transporter periplasmic adaptor subunit [Gammaproteobacteria bacterium]